MRVENSVRNATFGAVKLLAFTLSKFLIRTVFIYTLGIEYLGLDGLFGSILTMLSLAELGIGAVIVFALYKPIQNNDNEKIAAYINLYKKIYTAVACFVLVAGTALIPFLGKLISGEPPANIDIRIVFSIYLLNTAVGYLFSYKRTLLFVNQRNDIESKASTLFLIISTAVQCSILLLVKNYYLYIGVMPVFVVAENILLSVIVNKKYPFIKDYKKAAISKDEKKSLGKNIAAMVGHKLGGVAVAATDNILISAFLGLTILGIYSNYYLIVSTVATALGVIMTAPIASIGSSVAGESVEKNYRDFKNLSFLNFWLCGFTSVCILVLTQPFLELWAGSQNVLGIELCVLMTVSFAVGRSRVVEENYKNVSGAFYHDRFKPLVEVAVNLILSIVLLNYIGIWGVVIGTVVAGLFFAMPIEVYVLYKHYFKKKVYTYFVVYALAAALIVGVGAATYFICALIPLVGVSALIAKLAICLVLPNLIFFAVTFKTKEFRYMVGLTVTLMRKIKSKITKGKKNKPSEEESEKKE